jgi:hypothetical protein
VTNVTHRRALLGDDRGRPRGGDDDVRANFDDPLRLDNGNRRVDAAGPLVWDGQTGECEIAVTITQNVNGTTVTATGDSGDYRAPSDRWDADADTRDHEQLQSGATAQAVGIITLKSSSHKIQWSQPVTLQ